MVNHEGQIYRQETSNETADTDWLNQMIEPTNSIRLIKQESPGISESTSEVPGLFRCPEIAAQGLLLMDRFDEINRPECLYWHPVQAL